MRVSFLQIGIQSLWKDKFIMWGGLSDLVTNVAEKGASLLKELDERIDEDEEIYEDSDGVQRSRPATGGARGGDSESDDDIDSVLPSWADHSAMEGQNDDDGEEVSSYSGATDTATDKSSPSAASPKDIRELQAELAQVKAMREDLKTEVRVCACVCVCILRVCVSTSFSP